MPRLILQVDRESKVVHVDKDVIVIGRSSRCELPLDDKLVSRRHAKIAREGSAFILYDLGSKNGTQVNGSRIDRHALIAGDRIEIGSCVIYFESSPRAGKDPHTDLDLIPLLEEKGAPAPEPSGPPALFVLTDSNGNLQNFEVPFRKILDGITVGRSRDNDVSIPDEGVSGRHLRVTWSDGSYFVTDLGSTNGTYINGRLATGGIIKTGDRIQMGAVKIEFFANAAEAGFDKDSFENLEGLLIESGQARRGRDRRRLAVPLIAAGVITAAAGLILGAVVSRGTERPMPSLIHEAASIKSAADWPQRWSTEHDEGGVEIAPVNYGAPGTAAIRFAFADTGHARRARAMTAEPVLVTSAGPYAFSGRIAAADLAGCAALQIAWLDKGRLIGVSSSVGVSGKENKSVSVLARPPAGATDLVAVLYAAAASGEAIFENLSLVATNRTSEGKQLSPIPLGKEFTASASPTGTFTIGLSGGTDLLRDVCLVGLDALGLIVYTQDLGTTAAVHGEEGELSATGRLASLSASARGVDFELTARSAGEGLAVAAAIRRITPPDAMIRWGLKIAIPQDLQARSWEAYDGQSASFPRESRPVRELVVRGPWGRLALRFGAQTFLLRSSADPCAPPRRTPASFSDPVYLIVLTDPPSSPPSAPSPTPTGNDGGERTFAVTISTTDSELDARLRDNLAEADRCIARFDFTRADDICKSLERSFKLVDWLGAELQSRRAAIANREKDFKRQAEAALQEARTYGRRGDFEAAEALYGDIIRRSRNAELLASAKRDMALIETLKEKAPWRKTARGQWLQALLQSLRAARSETSARLVESYLAQEAAGEHRLEEKPADSKRGSDGG